MPVILKTLTLTLLLGLISCSPGNFPSSTIDQLESSSQVEAPMETAQRVVALTSLSADILQRLNPSVLVGVPGSGLISSDDRFSDIPTVSEGRTPPNLELILALEPDLVVGAAGFHDQALQRIEELGIRGIATEVTTWEDLGDLTQQLAALTEADAEPLLIQYASLLPEKPPASKPSMLVLVSQKPILTPSPTSWAGDLLTQLQGDNLVADTQTLSEFPGYVTLSAETLLAQDPDVLILVNDPGGQVEGLKTQSFWQELTAVKRDRVYEFDYYGLVNPGSITKITEASQKLTTIIYGEK